MIDGLYYGFDLGTSSSKGVVFSLDGETRESVVLEHSYESPKPGWQEQDPEKIWWHDFLRVTSELKDRIGARFETIRALGITGLVPVLTLLQDDGLPLRPGILHTDTRAAGELGEINAVLEDDISLGTIMPKLIWIKKHEPALFGRCRTIISAHSYLVYKLTGTTGFDFDTATIAGGVFDPQTEDWDPEAVESLGLSPTLFPGLFPATSVQGHIEEQAAEQTGLPPGLPVIAGTGDSFASLMGCGAVRRNDLMLYLGTSCTQIFLNDHISSFTGGPHFGPGKADFGGRIF